MYFDSHCHLSDGRFTDDLDGVLERARRAGVDRIVSIASDVADAEHLVELVSSRADLWATAGIHPHVAGDAGPGDLERVAELARAHERVVAIGETGLDFHYDNSPRPVQRRRFQEQLELAAELGLPVVVHTRDAEEDTTAILREMGPAVTGVLHCFTGSRDLLEEGLEVGWYVSYSGIVTFSSFDGREGVEAVPRDRLLIETDAPYLAPVPNRGRRNEPAFVVHVAEAVAGIRDEEAEEVGRYTARNAARFYGLSLP